MAKRNVARPSRDVIHTTSDSNSDLHFLQFEIAPKKVVVVYVYGHNHVVRGPFASVEEAENAAFAHESDLDDAEEIFDFCADEDIVLDFVAPTGALIGRLINNLHSIRRRIWTSFDMAGNLIGDRTDLWHGIAFFFGEAFTSGVRGWAEVYENGFSGLYVVVAYRQDQEPNYRFGDNGPEVVGDQSYLAISNLSVIKGPFDDPQKAADELECIRPPQCRRHGTVVMTGPDDQIIGNLCRDSDKYDAFYAEDGPRMEAYGMVSTEIAVAIRYYTDYTGFNLAARAGRAEKLMHTAKLVPFSLARARQGDPIQTRAGKLAKFVAHVPGNVDLQRVIVNIERQVHLYSDFGFNERSENDSDTDLVMRKGTRTYYLVLCSGNEAKYFADFETAHQACQGLALNKLPLPVEVPVDSLGNIRYE